MDKKLSLLVAVIIVAAMVVTYISWDECSSKGGSLVRGLFFYECQINAKYYSKEVK